MTVKIQATKYPHVLQGFLKSPCACRESTKNIRILIGKTRGEVLPEQIQKCTELAKRYFKAVQGFEGFRSEFSIAVKSSIDPDGADLAALKIVRLEKDIQKIAQERETLFTDTGLVFQVFVNKKLI